MCTERMLSPRLLHFAGHQIYVSKAFVPTGTETLVIFRQWHCPIKQCGKADLDNAKWDCATFSACEALPDGLPDRLDTVSATERHWRERLQIMQTTSTKAGATGFYGAADDSVEAFWARAVRDYTACNLTNCVDRMSAIWGVAKLVREQLRIDLAGDEYGVGLWRNQLVVQLAWTIVDYTKAEREVALEVFPSWSWASLMGEIETVSRLAYSEADSDAYYRVKDHSGGDVIFEVTTEQSEDFQPTLKRNDLAMKGNLIRAKVSLSTISHRCGLEVLDGTSAHGGEEKDRSTVSRNFEVFPDTADAAKDNTACFLLVLAASRSKREAEQNTSQAQGLIGGIGLVLREFHGRKGSQPCYQRTGSFRFQGVAEDVYNRLGGKAATDFWLC